MDERETRPLHVQFNQDAFGEKVAELIAENDRLRGERDALQARLDAQGHETSLEERAQLLDLVREAVIVHNLEAGTISFWNPGAEALYGYSGDEAIGRVADELLDTRFPRPLKDIETELLRRGRWEGELVQRRKDGARRVILSRWALQHDEGGRPRAIIEINSDLTPQKQEAETHAELAAIVQYAQDAIMSTDTAGRIMSWNPAAERLFGYSAAEVVGKPGRRIVPEALWGEVASVHERLREGQIVPTYETQRLKKDGSVVDVAVTASHIRNAQGAVIGFSLTMRDISCEKEAQALMQARVQALEEADRMKDQFLGILSHELRTPINAITGFASVLEDELPGPLNGEQHRYVERILGGADLLLNLVEDLLDLSRLQAGRLELAREPVDLAEEARQVAHQLNGVVSESGCSVAVAAEKPAPPVLADAQRVRQVLTHLLGNAVKFSASGPCTVTVAIEPAGEVVRCAVKDRGIGIAEADMDRLFKPFSQLDMTDTRDAGGTGIGLSTVKALVEAMGGAVGVESRVGEGSTFWFTLPAVLAS